MSWEILAKQYRERGLVLALGAGISLGSGIPTWEQLLRRIAGTVVNSQRQGNRIFDDLSHYGFSLPTIASILEGSCRANNFKEIVRSELYRRFPFRKGVTPQNSNQFVSHIKKHNETLAAVASLCAMKSPEARGFERNNRIHAIVNFNLDSILRAYMYERYKSYILRSVERASKASDLKKTSVYYMHGFLRFDLRENDPAEEAADKMVLTENDYFDFFNRPTSLFNYTFLYLLREYPTLFIGLSMIDENIRRLLHYSRAEREIAYIEEGRDAITKALPRHFVIIKRSHKHLDDLIEKSVSVLGAFILWVDDYKEIPLRLAEVYRSSGGVWEDVW